MPYLNGAIFRSRDDDRKLGVVYSEADVGGVALERRDQGLCGVIPNLDGPVIRCSEQVWLVRLRVVVDKVDALCFVGFEGEIGRRAAKGPYLDGPVETGGGECVGVLGVDG